MSELDELLKHMTQGGAQVTGINLRYVVRCPVTSDDNGNAHIEFVPGFRQALLGLGATLVADHGAGGAPDSSGGKQIGYQNLSQYGFGLTICNTQTAAPWKNLSFHINYLAVGLD